MTRAIFFSFLIAFAAPTQSGELSNEIDSHESAFHHMLHRGAEFYLVCNYDVKKLPWAKEWEQLHIKATIVEVYKGKKKVGDKIEYTRVRDGKFGDISPFTGALFFVRMDETSPEEAKSGEKEKHFVDPQDPQSVFTYQADFQKVAREHMVGETESAHKKAAPAEAESD